MIQLSDEDRTGFRNTFCEAKFYRPTGLGNRLFSWARAKVFSHKTGCIMLSPDWAHIRGASILRGGIDYGNALRKILLFDNFQPDTCEVTGLAKLILRRRCTVVSVSTLQEAFSLSQVIHGDRLISFSGRMAHLFDELWEHRELVFSSLKNITREKWKLQAVVGSEQFIGVNVRMGNDYKKTTNAGDFLKNKGVYLQTPLDWYVNSLRKIRKLIGEDIRAIVISDGNEQDLQLLLKEPNMLFVKSASAIGDLLILTKAMLLIGAGRSSFSAWASFLAKIPTITIPGSNLQGFHVSEDISDHYVGEFDPDYPSSQFCKAIKNL